MGNNFAYYKLECNDLDTIRETLTKEQGFDLICALVDYSRDGTITELPAELRIPFAMLKKKVDQAHKAYEDKCNILKENGRKGGKAKAKNRGQATGSAPAQAKKFKPPTLKQFKNAVEVYDDEVSDYDIESFYDQLNEGRWQFEGVVIQSRKDWEAIMQARFYNCYEPKTPRVFYKAFSYLLSAYPQLHYRWDDVRSIVENLMDDCWDSADSAWTVEGCTFKNAEWKAALDALVAKWIEDMPP